MTAAVWNLWPTEQALL